MQPINSNQLTGLIGSSQTQKKTRIDYANSTETIKWKDLHVPAREFIHQAMKDTYNNLWKHSKLPLSWELMIGELSTDEIKRGVWRCMKEEEYPPSPAKFRTLATESDFDFDASFDRFIAKEPLNDIEWFASQKVGFKCRGQWAEDRARKEWKAAIEYYMKLDKEGKLPERGQQRIENTNKKSGCDWQGPDGIFYKSPAEYWIQKNKTN